MWLYVNQGLNQVFDVWLWPFKSLSPISQIVALSVPATVFSLLVFRYTSNQDGIRREKDKIKAYLLEMRLFKDDLGVTLRAEKEILKHTLSYMGCALLPMAVMIIPFILILVQVESRFAFKSLETGQEAILSVTVDPATTAQQVDSRLELPDGLWKATPAMRVEETGEILWRIQATRSGVHRAVVRIGDQSFEKNVRVDQGIIPLATTLYPVDDIRSLGFPAESGLNANHSVRLIELDYPRARSEFAGLSSASWWLFLFTLSLGFALRGFFGVTF
ncbi:MAG: hypothetical protein ACREEM_32925 [Blastocatellia bacterium]